MQSMVLSRMKMNPAEYSRWQQVWQSASAWQALVVARSRGRLMSAVPPVVELPPVVEEPPVVEVPPVVPPVVPAIVVEPPVLVPLAVPPHQRETLVSAA